MKNNISVMIVTIVIIVCAVGIVAIGYNYFKDDVLENNEISNIESGDVEEFINIPNNIENNNQIANEEKVSSKIDESKDRVYSMLDTKNEEYIVRIPFINVESPKAKEINDELLGLANAVKEQLENNDMWVHFYYSGYEMAFATDYEWYLNDNILSVVFRVEYEHQRHCNINFIENFDINTGENIDTKYILNYKGINEEEFIKELPKYYDNEFKIMYGNDWGERLKEYYDKTIEDIPSNLNEIPMYLDDKGNINMIIEIGALAEVSDKINIEVNDLENLNPYILKYSDNWVISRVDLIDLTDEQLNIAYNEIFARHGHDFKTQSLKEYFNSLSWYRPIDGKTVTLEELSNTERNNLKTIKEEIDSRKKY